MLNKLMTLLGLVDPHEDSDDFDEEGSPAAMEERERRVLRPAAGEAELIILRGTSGPERKEELAEFLKKGKMLIVDLRGMERDSGQSLLDFLCGVAYANRGTVLRVAGGIFLAAPRKTMVEEWEEENGA